MMDRETKAEAADSVPQPQPQLTADLEKASDKTLTTIETPAPVSSQTVPEPPLPATPDPPAQAFGEIPDGGLEAWLQVLGAWVILVPTWGLVNSFGVFQTYYETKLLPDTSSSSISWIGSLQASLLLIVGVISGPLYDGGWFRELVAGGLLLIVFGLFMTSLCTEYWQVLLAQGITTGIGMGLTFLPSAAILAQYFTKKRALVLGISSTGSPLAGMVVPIIFSRLEPAVGFGWATRVIAFIMLALSVIPIVFMHVRVPPPGKRRALFDPTGLRDVPFVILVLSLFFCFLVLYVVFFYIQLYAESRDLTTADFSPYIITLLNVGSVFGRVLPNAVADRAGNLNVLLSCALASAVLLLGWFGIRNLAGLIAFALLYGMSSGGIVSVTPSVIMSLTPDLGRVGARMGMGFLCTGTATLIGPPIAGAILSGYDDAAWKGTIGYASGGLLVGTIGVSIARLVVYQRKGGLIA